MQPLMSLLCLEGIKVFVNNIAKIAILYFCVDRFQVVYILYPLYQNADD